MSQFLDRVISAIVGLSLDPARVAECIALLPHQAHEAMEAGEFEEGVRLQERLVRLFPNEESPRKKLHTFRFFQRLMVEDLWFLAHFFRSMREFNEERRCLQRLWNVLRDLTSETALDKCEASMLRDQLVGFDPRAVDPAFQRLLLEGRYALDEELYEVACEHYLKACHLVPSDLRAAQGYARSALLARGSHRGLAIVGLYYHALGRSEEALRYLARAAGHSIHQRPVETLVMTAREIVGWDGPDASDEATLVGF
jgi:tetratricopeptide (TPR) repeat protein